VKKRIKISIWLFISAIVFSVIHNVVYAVFGFEEPVFFTFTLLSAAGFAVSFLFNAAAYIKEFFEYLKSRKK